MGNIGEAIENEWEIIGEAIENEWEIIGEAISCFFIAGLKRSYSTFWH